MEPETLKLTSLTFPSKPTYTQSTANLTLTLTFEKGQATFRKKGNKIHHTITPKMDFVVGTEEANVLDQYKCNFILKMSSLIGSGLVYSGFICLLERIVQVRLN